MLRSLRCSEVDPLLRALYAPDVGAAAGAGGGRGTIALRHGQWPADPALELEVGAGYDSFLSKNTPPRRRAR